MTEGNLGLRQERDAETGRKSGVTTEMRETHRERRQPSQSPLSARDTQPLGTCDELKTHYDSLSTNARKFGKKATKAKLVPQTWEGSLLNNNELPRNWCGKRGVLVGIAPVRRGRRR